MVPTADQEREQINSPFWFEKEGNSYICLAKCSAHLIVNLSGCGDGLEKMLYSLTVT